MTDSLLNLVRDARTGYIRAHGRMPKLLYMTKATVETLEQVPGLARTHLSPDQWKQHIVEMALAGKLFIAGLKVVISGDKGIDVRD